MLPMLYYIVGESIEWYIVEEYMMIDRLQEVLPHLEHLPQETREEIADYIEALEHEAFARGRIKDFPHKTSLVEHWEDPAGAWSDLPDNMFEELDKIRHSNPPTPPNCLLMKG